MREFLLATHNRNKIREFRVILDRVIGDYRLLTMDEVDFPDVEENGTTFEENALIKARSGASLGYLTIADDSGLSVDALGGAPGIFSARYSSPDPTDEKNNALLLENLSGKTDRSAHYVCVIAFATPDGKSFTVRGECDGEILKSPRGEGGFGYDPLFYSHELGKTFAEITMDEKNKISHRGIAGNLFSERLLSFFEENT